MGARTGQEYLERLRENPPRVFLGKEEIKDPILHPAFRGAARTIAHLYDLQHQEGRKDYMLFEENGELYSTQFLLPRTHDDLRKRFLTHMTFARATLGLMGRTTDFLGAMLSGFYLGRDYLGEFADNVANYYFYVREHDLFLTHALVDPPLDRSKPPWEQKSPYGALRVVGKERGGVIVRGAKLLATAAPYADEVFVWPFIPLGNYDKEKGGEFAIGFAIPTNAENLVFICREPYGTQGEFDHPLASRFDEMDCIAVFEDVFVPWERVFLYKQPDLVGDLYAPPRGSFSIHQSYIRLWQKLLFLAALAKKIAEISQVVVYPNVQHLIAEITTYAELTRAALIAAEAEAVRVCQNGETYLVPNVKPLLAVRVSASKWYPRVREIIQLIAGANLLFTPTEGTLDEDSPIRELARAVFSFPSLEERVGVLKLAYDLAISSFGGRHELYERFYAGDPYRLQINYQFVKYDWADAESLLEEAVSAVKGVFGGKRGGLDD
ncbi:MAG: 4-hydroxyphenylacetate 3-hydroxylase N-terminal domain-containing protein [Thermoproteota archaeon]|mgnify:FL=1